LNVAQLVKKFPWFVEPEASLPINPTKQYFGWDSCAPSQYKFLAPTECLRAPYHALCLFGLSATFRIARK
jgi:hypothetical protein